MNAALHVGNMLSEFEIRRRGVDRIAAENKQGIDLSRVDVAETRSFNEPN